MNPDDPVILSVFAFDFGVSEDYFRLMITRREFLVTTPLLGGAAFSMPLWLDYLAAEPRGRPPGSDKLEDLIRTAPKARYWVSTATAGSNCLKCHESVAEGAAVPYDHKRVILKCLLCAQGCVIPQGQRGRCRARINVKGELRSLVYGRPVSMHIDPIEKKPFYHFLPGSQAFSFATAGCPLRCQFCQNWEISQSTPEDYDADVRSPLRSIGGAARRAQGACHRLHLQRADGFHRVPARHRPRRASRSGCARCW